MLWHLPNISIAPDTIFTIFGFPVTNTLLGSIIAGIILILVFVLGTRRQELVPKGMQNAIEALVVFLLGLTNSVVGGDKARARKFFPLAASFFFFILVANLIDVLPGVDTVGQINTDEIAKLHTHSQPILGFLLFGDISNKIIPWIRPATTDLNLNIAMAVIAIVTSQVFGFYTLGPKVHLSKYVNVRGPIDFFVGILEFIGEFTRIISLSFRLFGNVFAGSAVLAVFAFLLPVVADLVFVPFEIFVAAVQAFIFALLTLIYLQITSVSHEEHGHEEEQGTADTRQGQKELAATH
ncbi:MAG: F0F1 ATP synthase subunit A [Ktedonobacteraceae bacterium]